MQEHNAKQNPLPSGMGSVKNQSRVAKIVKAALNYQDSLLRRLPPGKMDEVKGRTGKLIVDDPLNREGAVMYFTVADGRLVLLEEKPEKIRNEVIFFGTPHSGYSGVDCFLDSFRRKGSAREAYASGTVVVTGDLASYDSEELLQIIEDWIDKIAVNMEFRVK